MVLSAFAFRPAVTAWLTLGLAAAAILGALAAFAAPDQGTAARSIEVLIVIIGIWAIASCRTFGGPHTLKWICFADGVAVCALGGLGLLLHEAVLERRLRRLEEVERYRMAMTRPEGPSLLPGDPRLAG